jgi:hypothetical protein
MLLRKRVAGQMIIEADDAVGQRNGKSRAGVEQRVHAAARALGCVSAPGLEGGVQRRERYRPGQYGMGRC